MILLADLVSDDEQAVADAADRVVELANARLGEGSIAVSPEARRRFWLDRARTAAISAHTNAFKINEEADWYTGNMAPGTSECGWLLNKTAYEALPEQYQKFLMDNREMVLDTELAAYAAQDEVNLKLFEETLQKITYSDEQLAEFREKAGRPVWNDWIEANKDKFDAQQRDCKSTTTTRLVSRV